MKSRIAGLIFALAAVTAYATWREFVVSEVDGATIKTWSSGETITSTDLNANFNHIHTLMVGGHGARLVNADISNSAAIANTKLASGHLIPRKWGAVTTTCTSSPCTLAAGQGITSITRGSIGAYTINYNGVLPDANYNVMITANLGSVGQANWTTNGVPVCVPIGSSRGLSSVGLGCYSIPVVADGGGQVPQLTDMGFDFVVIDGN